MARISKLNIEIINIIKNYSRSLQSIKKLKFLQHNLGLELILQTDKYGGYYSITHSHNYVALARYLNKVGIDIELIDKKKGKRVNLLPDSEKKLSLKYDFTSIWVLKEAIAKYHTIGLPRIDVIKIEAIENQVVYYRIKRKQVEKLEYRFIDVNPSYRLCVVTKKIPNIYIHIKNVENKNTEYI